MYQFNFGGAIATVHKHTTGWELIINGIQVPIKQETLEKVLVGTIPETELAYSVNLDTSCIFYSLEYPEYSIRTHPGFMVAGNIYYDSKYDAIGKLNTLIQEKIEEHEGKIKYLKTKLL